MAAPPDEDPAAPVFFMSYWRPKQPAHPVGPPREVNRHVIQLFEDLTDDVNHLIGSVPGRDPGFLDVAADGGGRWEARLLRAVGTCKVFVSLLSGPYLRNSEWCAREWDGFSRRRVVPRTVDAEPDESAIVPVLWAPINGPLPKVVADVSLFEPTGLPRADFRALYLEEGLLGLLKTGRTDIYQAIVWRLAQHVERIQRTHRVEPMVLDRPDELHTTFERGPG